MTELTNCIVRVCPERDIECCNHEANWCATCPKRRATPSSECALPQLPEPVDTLAVADGFNVIESQDVYTAEQVEQIRREAVDADRRARASIDGQLTEHPSPVKQPVSAAQGEFDEKAEFANFVRWSKQHTEETRGAIMVPREAWMAAKREAFAQLARQSQEPQAERDGWKWVPVEPTEAMVHAAQDLPPPRMFGVVYRTMLAAAPAHPVAQPAPESTEDRT